MDQRTSAEDLSRSREFAGAGYSSTDNEEYEAGRVTDRNESA